MPVSSSAPTAIPRLCTRSPATLSGGIPALIAWTKKNQPDILKQVPLPKNIEALEGQVSLGLVATIVTDKKTNAPAAWTTSSTGALQDLGTSSPIEGHTIGKGQLQFRVTQAGFNVGGTTEFDGVPAEISAMGTLDPKKPDVLLTAKVDSDAFKKFGVDTSAFLKGPLTVSAKPLADGSIQLVADLGAAEPERQGSRHQQGGRGQGHG